MKRIQFFILYILFTISLFAVPANRRPFVVKQSDGTMLSLTLNGDEALHYYMTLDGKYVVKEDDGDYCYATFSQDTGFVSSGILAHNAGNRSDRESEFLSTIDYDVIKEDISKIHSALSARYRNVPATRASVSSPITKGEMLVPVLLVEFSDMKFSFTKGDIDKLLNEENYKYNFMNIHTTYGSARDYFIDQSEGQFVPEFVVADIVTLSHPMAYYGGNTSSQGGSDKNPQGMLREAIGLADSKMNFAQFDNDGDGNVEFVYCIYAGYSEAVGADSNTVWPHQWLISSDRGGKKKVDGVYCDVYACSSELYLNESMEKEYGKWLAGIGTICHEFSHCLGLHDVYDVTYESGNWGMDEWDLMDQGSYAGDGYLPVGYNSHQKEECGWKKLEVLEKKGNYSMKPQSQGGVGYKIVNDANPNEYYVLENRKREKWDQAMRADGMMIIHVDYDANAWDNNEINTTAGRPRFQLVPADNDLTVYGSVDADKFYESLAKDLWPGPSGNTEFTDTSIPAAKVFAGGFLNKPVTKIKYENNIVSFAFMGGVVSVPEIAPATDITINSFIANWNMADDATEYVVELYELADTANGNGDVDKILEEDFMKCSMSSASITDDLDEYMSVPGWTGSNVYSENGVVRIGALSTPGMIETPLMNVSGKIVASFDIQKYKPNDAGVNVKVEVLYKSGDVAMTDEVSSEGTVELRCDVDGEFYLRFSTDGMADVKRALIDNVSVSAILPYRRELLETVVVEGDSHKFDGLGQGRYAYRVKSVDGDNESGFSEFAEVILGTTSVVDVQGTIDGLVEVYAIDGTMKYCGRKELLPKLQRGIYIIRKGRTAKKVFVK